MFVVSLSQVANARPNDAEAKRKALECNKIVRKIAFEKAISVETKSIADSIDFESMGKYYVKSIHGLSH